MIVVVLTVAALVLRLYRLRYGNAHAVVDYDSGVYFGSSLELVTGTLPYRDYVFVHPPGITLLFAPDALLAQLIGTAKAMGLAKIATGVAGAASVPLVGMLVRGRGRAALALACGIAAFQGDAVASSYTLLLEPWLVLFCLIGATLAFRAGVRGGVLNTVAGSRRLRWAGVALGVACATKIWAIAPVLALAIVLVRHRRQLRTFLLGAFLGFVVPSLPFFLLAPNAFVHQVFTVQIFRTSSTHRTALSQRLIHMFSVAAPNGDFPSAGSGLLFASAILVIAGLLFAWVIAGRGRSVFERFAGLAALLAVALLLAPETFYWHYAAFSTPFLAVAAAVVLPRLRGVGRRMLVVLLTLAVGGLGFTMLHRDLRGYHLTDDHVAVQAAVPPGACVVSTMVSSTIAADRFYSADPSCPVLIDSFGTVLSDADGQSPSQSSLRGPTIRALWLRIYERADFLYIKHRDSPTVPSDPTLTRYLHQHFRVVPVDSAGVLYQRRP